MEMSFKMQYKRFFKRKTLSIRNLVEIAIVNILFQETNKQAILYFYRAKSSVQILLIKMIKH
jgi:hypothetical protein